MRDTWQAKPLGEMTARRIEAVELKPDELYVNLGVKWYAEGTFRREPKPGSAIKASKLFRVRPGQFVYNRLFATEGSFALIKDDDADAVASNEFPVFDVDQEQLLPDYLALYFQQRSVWERVSAQCVGTTKSRLRWKEDLFARFVLPTPPLVEQHRIVDLIGVMDDVIVAAGQNRMDLEAFLAARRDALFSRGPQRRAADMFDVLIGLQRSPARSAGPNQIPYLRSYNVGDGHLILDDIKTMSFSADQQDKYALAEGDVLVSEGSASEKAVGAPAPYRSELEGVVGFQNTLLRYRAIPGISTPSFVSHWCSWAYASGAFRDIASGTNIKHIGSGGANAMSVIDLSVEEQDVLTPELDAIRDGLIELGTRLSTLRTLRSNLLTVLLSGEHEIPETYDELMEAVA